ncbi:MAG TPA: carboxypeptidase-like regulatory domain-containing protein [Gemmatimonadaceae bacterium]|jgi:hypothetical protein
MRIRLAFVLCAAVIASPAGAQSGQAARTGTIVGTVARDSAGTMVGQAQIQLPALNRSATTNWLGEFQFSDVPAGRYAITVRAVGFQPLVDSLIVGPSARVDADIILTAAPVNLATQHTTASAVEKRLPPGLQEMADRMKTGLGGYFVTDSMLRARDNKLTDFVAKIPHLTQALSNGTGIFLANGREHGNGGPVFYGVRGDTAKIKTFNHNLCYVNVYVDGAPYFIGPATEQNPPPDIGAMWAHDYSGVEYYPGGATIPSEYATSKSSCGVMLLWMRRTP